MELRSRYAALLLVGVGVFCASLIFFLMNPVLNSLNPPLIQVYRIRDLADAYNYYATLASIFSILTGLAGLTLGYLYFDKRNKIEDARRKQERQENRINIVIDQLDKYDSLVSSIITKSYNGEQELEKLRSILSRGFETITTILELDDRILSWESNEKDALISLYSFVDNSQELMVMPCTKLTTTLLKLVEEEYISLFQEAKQLCFIKSDSIY